MKKKNILVLILGLVALLLLAKKKMSPVVFTPSATALTLAAETLQTIPPPSAGAAAGANASGSGNLISTSVVLATGDTNLPGQIPAPEISALPPLTVLDNTRVLIHNYAAQFGENPVGDNSEITATLTGKNPRQINFLRTDSGLRMNARGELLDAYGTPFFFHQVSSRLMEIRSAGEDKILWTLDDQVTR